MIRSRSATTYKSVFVPLLLLLLGGRTALLPQYRHNGLVIYVADAFCLTPPRTHIIRTKASSVGVGGSLCMSKKTQPPRYQKPYQWRRGEEKDGYDDDEEEKNDIFDQDGVESYGSNSSRQRRRRPTNKGGRVGSLSTVGNSDGRKNKPQQRGGRGSKPYAKKRRGNRTSPRVASSFNSTDGGIGSTEEKEEEEEEKPIQTLGGGSSLIFAMARRMLVWQNDNLAFNDSSAANDNRNNNASPSSTTPTLTTTGRSSSPVPPVLPRWHPHGGISDVNPSFRNKPPVMNNAGYAGVIRRNSRKRNKPSMWRHSLRMYEKMKSLELKKKEDGGERGDGGVKSAAAAAAGATTSGGRRLLSIQRGTIHHEGALVSCAKLGLWEEALRIYNEVEKEGTKKDESKKIQLMNRSSSASGLANVNVGGVTDNMVLSVVSACVRGSKKKTKSGREKKRGGGGNDECEGGDDGCVPVEERRVPLDRAREILLSLEGDLL